MKLSLQFDSRTAPLLVDSSKCGQVDSLAGELVDSSAYGHCAFVNSPIKF
jgi:hypothetical protein